MSKMEWWVCCGHCSSHSSPLTSTNIYLTSCGHFSCNHCLSQAPIPKPPSTGYCYDCKKPCSVVNLSQRDKLSPDVAFYFKDPGNLCQKILEVYNFQNIHRRKRYEGELRKRLMQEIAIARQIRERSEKYIPFVNKIYEVLYTKYGIKPLAQRCEFSPGEVEEFISEVAKVRKKREQGRGEMRRLAAVVTDPDATMMDMELRTPSQSSMCTPSQSPVSGRGSMMRVGSACGSGGGSGGGEGGEGSSLFRAHVQSEMRSGGRGRGGGGGGGGSGGNHSQYTTPTGSVCSKPSPLLNDKRASQPLPVPRAIPPAHHINPYSSKIIQPSSVLTPPTDTNMTNAQNRLVNAPYLNESADVFQQSLTPMSVRSSSHVARASGGGGSIDLRADSRPISSCNLGSLLAGTGKQVVLRSSGTGARLSTGSPGSIKMPSASPRSGLGMRVSPMSIGAPPTNPRSVQLTCNFPGSRLSCASLSSMSSSNALGSADGQVSSATPAGSRLSVPVGFGSSRVSSVLLPVPHSVGQVQLNSVQRKPLSGVSVPLMHPPPRLQDYRGRGNLQLAPSQLDLMYQRGRQFS